MKRWLEKRPIWLRLLLYSVALFLVAVVYAAIGEGVFHFDMDDAPRIADKVFMGGFMILVFIWNGLVIAVVVSIVKAVIARAKTKYTPPDVSVVKNSRRPDKIERRQLYDSDKEFQMRHADAPTTWGMVCMGLAFFPLGFFLMIRKLIEEKSRYYENGITVSVIGAVILVLSSLPTAAFCTQIEFEMISLIFLFPAVLGIGMITAGLLIRHKGKIQDDYMIVLKIDKITKLDEIAQIMKTDYAHTAAVIQRLIDNEQLKGAYIHHTDREVILPGISGKIALRCRGCGATTVLYSTDKHECAYCGAEL